MAAKSEVGYVYIMENPNMPGCSKIGETGRTPKARAQEILVSGTPSQVFDSVYVRHPSRLERSVHAYLDEYRLSGTEWFRIQPDDAFEALFECIAPFNDIDSVKPDIIATDIATAAKVPAKKMWNNLTPEKAKEYATIIVKSTPPTKPDNSPILSIIAGAFGGALIGFFPSLFLALIFDSTGPIINGMILTAILGSIWGSKRYFNEKDAYENYDEASKIDSWARMILTDPTLLDAFDHIIRRERKSIKPTRQYEVPGG